MESQVTESNPFEFNRYTALVFKANKHACGIGPRGTRGLAPPVSYVYLLYM